MSQAAFLAIAGKERLCGGLSWLPLVAEDRSAQRTEFRRFLRDHRSAYGLLVPAGDRQRYAMAGVVVVEKGTRHKHVTGIPAAAQWFAASVTEPTIYVERMDSGLYWVLLATGGGIDPRTDRMLKPAALVALVDEFERELEQDSLKVYCWPGIEAMPGELCVTTQLRETNLIDLLSPDKRPALKVGKQIGPPTWVVPTVIGVGAIAVSGFLGMEAYESLQSQREASRIAAERAAAEAAEQLRSRQAEQDEQERKRSSIHDALRSPSPHAMIDACVTAATDLPTRLGGWKLSRVRCDAGSGLVANYARDAGRGSLATQESFARAANDAGLGYDQTWFGTDATVRAGRLELEARQASVASLPPTAQAGEALATHAIRVQAITKTGSFQAGDAQMPRLDDEAGADPGFRTHTAQMGGAGLWMLKVVVPDLPHLKLESIDLTRNDARWRWSAVGVLYTSSEQS